MRKISLSVLLLSSFIFAVTFVSCSDNSPVTPDAQENIQWQAVDSIDNQSIDNSFMAGENDAFFINFSNTYRINNGVKTIVDFQDGNFHGICGNAYNPSYYAIGGATSGSRGVLKIFNNGVLSTVEIDNAINSSPNIIKIISPGRIIIAAAYKIYEYNNGNMRLVTSVNPGNRIYTMVPHDNANIYLSVFHELDSNKTYRLSNDTLVNIHTEVTRYIKFQSNNNLFGITKNSALSTISYLNAAGAWNPLCADSPNHTFFYSAGESMNYNYFVSFDSTNGNMRGSYYTNGVYKRDAGFPFQNENTIFTSISTMKNDNFYFSKYVMPKNKTYIYKAKRTV